MFLGHVKACCIANGGTEPYHKLSNVVVGIKAGILMWTLREELKEQEIRRDRGPKRETENWEEAGRKEWRKEWKNKGKSWHLTGDTHLSKMGVNSPVLEGKKGRHIFASFSSLPLFQSFAHLYAHSFVSSFPQQNCLSAFPNVSGCQRTLIVPFNLGQNHKLFLNLHLNLVPGTRVCQWPPRDVSREEEHFLLILSFFFWGGVGDWKKVLECA